MVSCGELCAGRIDPRMSVSINQACLSTTIIHWIGNSFQNAGFGEIDGPSVPKYILRASRNVQAGGHSSDSDGENRSKRVPFALR